MTGVIHACLVCGSDVHNPKNETCSSSCRAFLSQRRRIENLRTNPPTPTALWHELSRRWVDPELGVVYAHFGTGPLRKVDDAGYIAVNDHYRAHTIVWESVNGPVPAGMAINHIDFRRTNNRITNLECTTPGGNVRHSARAGRMNVPRLALRGDLHHKAVLSKDQVHEIRQRTATSTVLAERYGVSNSTIKAIWARRIWSWLD